MDSKIAVDGRLSFASRLIAALTAAHEPTTPSGFARAYNLRADGAEVTVHGGRKWLLGEAIPTQDKVLILAKWLNVQASWLRFGDAQNGEYQAVADPGGTLSTKDLVLINDIVSLGPSAQNVVRDLVNSLLRAKAEDLNGGERQPHRNTMG